MWNNSDFLGILKHHKRQEVKMELKYFPDISKDR